MPESGQELSARFTLVRRLGHGGGGEVWLGEDRERHRAIAIKLLPEAIAADEPALQSIESIMVRVAALGDRNIVHVEGLFRAPGRAWLAMELASGGDLTSLRGRPCAEVIVAVMPIARALARVHHVGIVHRDVKPSNIVLMADATPKLTDFGAALLSDERPDRFTAAGSVYNMSPAALEGAPATVADDVYAFGAMLYELLSGYPPFYPDVTAERIRCEAPATLETKGQVTGVLSELIASCLAKDPAHRPASMEAIEATLALVLKQLTASAARSGAKLEQSMSTRELEPGTPPRSDAPIIRPPTLSAEPLRGEWRRSSASASDPGEFRRQGFRRGLMVSIVLLGALGIFFVFFALPKWVGSNQPQQAVRPAAQPVEKPAAAKPQAPVDFAALARAKQQAEELREPLAERLEKLSERGVAQWGAEEHKRAADELALGDAQAAEREYVVAVEHFQQAEPIVAALELRASAVLKEQLTAGSQALNEGRASDARSAFELALQLEPKNAAATRGLARAGTLDRVLALLSAGERAEAEGDANAAIAAYREALALDKDAPRANDGLARVSSRVAGDAFASAMARGFAALGAGNFAAARSDFESAGKIRPNAAEVSAALKQVEQDERTRTIAGKLDQARGLESREAWADALRLYHEVLALDSTIAPATEAVARVQPRAKLNEQLEMYLTQPERLFSTPVRAAARETLQRAGAIATPGPVLTQQIATLRDWLARADVPVQVALLSDNLTQVTIHRIGALGAFEQRSLELEPGEYTVLGTRPGYRDVRRQIMVTPGAPLPPVVIRCEDKI